MESKCNFLVEGAWTAGPCESQKKDLVSKLRSGGIFFMGNQWVFIVPDHKAGYLLGG